MAAVGVAPGPGGAGLSRAAVPQGEVPLHDGGSRYEGERRNVLGAKFGPNYLKTKLGNTRMLSG